MSSGDPGSSLRFVRDDGLALILERLHLHPLADHEGVRHEAERGVVDFRLARVEQRVEAPVDAPGTRRAPPAPPRRPPISRQLPPWVSLRVRPASVSTSMSQVCGPVWRQSKTAWRSPWPWLIEKARLAAIGASRLAGNSRLERLDEDRLGHDAGDDGERVDARIEDAEAAGLPDPLLARMPVPHILFPGHEKPLDRPAGESLLGLVDGLVVLGSARS